MGLLNGKIIIITGATSGIGEAAAFEVAKEGGTAVLAARRADRGQELVKRIEDLGGKADFIRTDVTKEADIKNLIDLTVQRYGKIDGAYNNAGISLGSIPLDELPSDTYEGLMRVNLSSIFWCLKYEALAMKVTGGGAIVNCSSVFGTITSPGTGAYTSSKHAVIGMTKTAAVDFGPYGIRVNCVLPGPTESEIWKARPNGQEVLTDFASNTILKRPAKASEIAMPVIFLLSDGASYITGTQLIIDGGMTVL